MPAKPAPDVPLPDALTSASPLPVAEKSRPPFSLVGIDHAVL
jgi:hypothetical protein